MFLRGCSWDGRRDLVDQRGHARRPNWQRRRRAAAAEAADSTSAFERDAGSAECQETGWRRSCSCRNMSLWRILANRRLRARIAPFRLGSADPRLDLKIRFLGQILTVSDPFGVFVWVFRSTGESVQVDFRDVIWPKRFVWVFGSNRWRCS
jgi:hypothetical protein